MIARGSYLEEFPKIVKIPDTGTQVSDSSIHHFVGLEHSEHVTLLLVLEVRDENTQRFRSESALCDEKHVKITLDTTRRVYVM